jgi:hypothetical protein
MLDVTDFIKERGGDPEKIRESQRRRYAKVEAVDEIIEMYEDHRKTQYAATQINTKINDVNKLIGAKKKVASHSNPLEIFPARVTNLLYFRPRRTLTSSSSSELISTRRRKLFSILQPRKTLP